jgi:hypothetical protein
MEAWNKGLKTGKLSEKHRLKISNTMKGKKPKNFDEMLKKGIEFQKLNHGNSGTWKVGHKHKEEILKKISDSLKGNIPWNEGLTTREEEYVVPTHHINGKNIPVSHIVWCQANQIHRIPDGCIIHHLDLNPQNNNPETLQLLEDRYHRVMHIELMKILRKQKQEIII